MSYVTGHHNFKFGFQYTWGDFTHTVDANADLTQQYRSNSTRVPFSVPDSVVIRNTPLAYGERLNRDFGIYAQDSWRLNRLTLNAGIRWETIRAQVLAAESPAGRFVPARTFQAVENLPNWKDWAPRLALVYDLFGTGKTALKYSLNRYNQIRTTGIASNYNPLASITATLPWRDVNSNDIAEGARGCTGYPRVDCEIDFSTLAANFGTASLNTYGNYPRTWNLENAVEVQHELFSEVSVAANYFTGEFNNLTTSINQAWSLADYSPYTWYNPLTGAPFTVYARTPAATARPTNNLDTFDPERRQAYQSFGLEFRARIPGGGQVFGGGTFDRERVTNCTAPDDPNYVSTTAGTFNGLGLCDDFEERHSVAQGFQGVGNVPAEMGRERQPRLSEQPEPDQQPRHDGHPRGDALPGELPGAVPGQRDHHADGSLRSVHADLCAAAAARQLRRAHRPARHQADPDVPLRPGVGAARVRDVQRQQLRRDHQLRVDQLAGGQLPQAEQHHAGADDGNRRDHSLVGGLGLGTWDLGT